MFFKRLSRSRASSNSYVEDDYEDISPPTTTTAAAATHPPSYAVTAPHPDSSGAEIAKDRMYSARALDSGAPYSPKDNSYSSDSARGASGQYMANGMASRGAPQPTQQDSYDEGPSPSISKAAELALPDMLTRAFHESIRPYQDKIEQLEEQLAQMQEYISQQEQQRLDIFAWIDKRGLRPDVPPHLAKALDTSTPDAASSLNAQLDRKITIVNFDLHRLQDDLNDSISSAHFASAMAKFVPDIRRLAGLPTGPRFAYELVIKLVGNLNGHGGLDGNGIEDEEDLNADQKARQDFYERMDDELVEIVRMRAAEDGAEWQVQREIKRLEKNAAYLRNLGVDNYFPHTQSVMRQEIVQQYGSGGGAPPAAAGASRTSAGA